MGWVFSLLPPPPPPDFYATVSFMIVIFFKGFFFFFPGDISITENRKISECFVKISIVCLFLSLTCMKEIVTLPDNLFVNEKYC